MKLLIYRIFNSRNETVEYLGTEDSHPGDTITEFLKIKYGEDHALSFDVLSIGYVSSDRLELEREARTILATHDLARVIDLLEREADDL